MKGLIISFAVALLVVTISCSNSSEPEIDPNDPVANPGGTQFTSVGSYFMLDGSKSTRGSGDTLIYKWYADPSNPAQFNLNNYNVKYYYRAAIKEGNYKFSLVVNNGIKESEPAQFVVKVGPRIVSVIQDTILEANIRYAAQKQFGDLTDSDFLSIKEMYTSGIVISSVKIKKLDGIERCKSLTSLDLTLQSLTDLRPLSNLSNLEHLELDQNWELTDVTPLASLTNLKYLDISSNKIVDISSLSTLKNLLNLIINGSPTYHLADLSVLRNFTSLKEFASSFIYNHDLTVFSNLKELQYFFCVYSHLSDLDGLKNCSKLLWLAVGSNDITDISTLLNFKELELLWADSNQIEDIGSLKYLEKLTNVILANNNIKDIRPLVENDGIGINTRIILSNNPLNEKSINEYIPQLRARGVTVIY